MLERLSKYKEWKWVPDQAESERSMLRMDRAPDLNT